jgi:Flp pilus assembly protein TadG
MYPVMAALINGSKVSQLGAAHRLGAALARLRSDNRAVALIEFAVVMPILVILLLPLVDLGMGFYAKTQVMTAAEAGAQYAFVHGWSGTSTTSQTSILSAVSSATSLSGVQASPVPVLACGCADGTTITYSSPGGSFSPSSCSAMTACASSQKPGAYVTVSAQASYTPLFTYLIFSGSTTLSATSIVRIQ